ncbi:MAG: AAA family ATPase [Acidimicrobiales bacterium]
MTEVGEVSELGDGLREVELVWDEVADRGCYPFAIPALRNLGVLPVGPGVTFLSGENGSGKSTLVEAVAIAAGLNPEGGSRHLAYSQRPTESDLHRHLVLRWARRPRTAYFLRAETLFNTATAYEGVETGGLHDRSHGQQVIEVATKLLHPGGFFVMDEPESALSVPGQLKLLTRMHDLVATGGQFLIATHSPVLLAFPGARIYQLDDDGVAAVAYEDTQPYQLTRSFLDSPERFFRHLFGP